jgi:hypothetical protein
MTASLWHRAAAFGFFDERVQVAHVEPDASIKAHWREPAVRYQIVDLVLADTDLVIHIWKRMIPEFAKLVGVA